MYQFDKHNNIKIFWKDLQKAVAINDKEAVSKMMHYTFIDYSGGGENAAVDGKLTCKNASECKTKYNKIFCKGIKQAIANNKYNTITNEEEEDANKASGSAISPSEYLINCEIGDSPDFLQGSIVIVKVKGKFKLYRISFYS